MTRTIAVNNQDKKLEYKERFTNIFETDIERFFGDDGNIGFDLDAFCCFIRPPQGKSLEKCIREQYGDEAVSLVAHLVS